MSTENGLYIVLVSIHGLIRGRQPELGRDADTGGQTLYVLELARALAAHPDVWRVDLLTRRVIDSKVASDYSEPLEQLADNAWIVRPGCGPRRYLRKESLWPYLDCFADSALRHISAVGRTPDLVHGHYADAGYVGSRLAAMLGVPFVFTGHSLGRDKQRRLLDQGAKASSIERQYNLKRRIEAEEVALDSAAVVIASTRQEVASQYAQYDDYQPKRMVVIPPGTDLQRFHPPTRSWSKPAIQPDIDRFLQHPGKPMILALSRADPRKNISTLLRAYGESPALRELANLVIFAGNRELIRDMDSGARKVMIEVLALIDRYDLYGHCAIPKHHGAEDVPDIYRLAMRRRGVFVNPALTEPFGLTLIEAAASGLPMVATEDGGPRDIIRECRNGLLIDPLDANAMAAALQDALSDRRRWLQWSKSGVAGARRRYTWSSHANQYLRTLKKHLGKTTRRRSLAPLKSRLPSVDRMLMCDIDNTLLGDPDALETLLERLRQSHQRVAFGLATGRSLESARKILNRHRVPMPDLLITSVGSGIYYGPNLVEDSSWLRHIDYRWDRSAALAMLDGYPGLRLQHSREQRPHKISYMVDPDRFEGATRLIRALRKADIHVNVTYSFKAFLDITPINASKGLALRYFAIKWGLPVERLLVVGDSGNDEEMLRGSTLGAVVGNHSGDLLSLHGKPEIYFAKGHYAQGILEAIDHYHFLDPQLPDHDSCPL